MKFDGKKRLVKIDGDGSVLYYFEFDENSWYLKKVRKYI
jgi:hypothetical protein